MGRYDEALADLNCTIELNPKSDWKRYQIALVKFIQGFSGRT